MTAKLHPAHDFVTIRDTFNRWRSENAPHLSRDEAIRYALGDWLVQRGYLAATAPAAGALAAKLGRP